VIAPGKFRHNALQRMSSPEHLDRLVKLTLPRRWIGLAALLVLVAAAILWSVVSSVPTTLSGPGYLISEGGLRTVQATATGTVRSFSLATGEHVVAGQVVGEIVGAGGSQVTPIRAPEAGTVSEVDSDQSTFVNTGQRLAVVEPVGWPLVVYAYVPTNVAADLYPGVEVHVSFGAGFGAAYGYAKGRVQSVSQFAASHERLDFILGNSAVTETVTKLGPANEVVIAMDQSASTPSGLVWGSGDGPPMPLSAGLPSTATFVIGSHHPISDVL
jgi:multidrug efflux pump subunit AcrA (membrane-fusion protein)